MSSSRGYDRRYAPQTITVAGSLLSWTYTTDPAGNVTAIQQTQPTSVARSFAYQDFQGFLTCAAGPWAPGSACDPPAGQPLAWSLDKIGNRLSEARDGATDTYSYLPNAASGNTPLLDEIALSTLGTRAYAFDAAGHLEEIAAGANVLDFGFDAEGRLAGVQRTAESFVDFRYDGRGFLAEVAATRPAFLGGIAPEAPATTVFADDFETGDVCEWTLAAGWGGTTCPQPPVESTLEAVYDSSGRLRALFPDGDPSDGTYLFYLAGRPVATLQSPFDPVWTFLTTDHLGTPILALDATATPRWLGGFEPYGHDWQSGAASATANGIPLRLPGQWSAPIWEDATLGTELFYNLHRWYETQTGRYASADPLSLGVLASGRAVGGLGAFKAFAIANFRLANPLFESPFVYGASNPIGIMDPDGQASFFGWIGPTLFFYGWTEVLTCEEENEICRNVCETQNCRGCFPLRGKYDARHLDRDRCFRDCRMACEGELHCFWKVVKIPLEHLPLHWFGKWRGLH